MAGTFDQRGFTGQPLYVNRNVFLWAYFPKIAKSQLTARQIGALYWDALDEYKKRHGGTAKHARKIAMTRKIRMELMQEVENRIVTRDWDDAFILLAV